MASKARHTFAEDLEVTEDGTPGCGISSVAERMLSMAQSLGIALRMLSMAQNPGIALQKKKKKAVIITGLWPGFQINHSRSFRDLVHPALSYHRALPRPFHQEMLSFLPSP